MDAVGKSAVLGVVVRGGQLVQSGCMTGGQLLSFSLYAAYFALGAAGLAKFAVSELAAGKRAAVKCAAALAVSEEGAGASCDRGAVALLAADPAA